MMSKYLLNIWVSKMLDETNCKSTCILISDRVKNYSQWMLWAATSVDHDQELMQSQCRASGFKGNIGSLMKTPHWWSQFRFLNKFAESRNLTWRRVPVHPALIKREGVPPFLKKKRTYLWKQVIRANHKDTIFDQLYNSFSKIGKVIAWFGYTNLTNTKNHWLLI